MNGLQSRRIYTVGHSTRADDDFISLLHRFHIRVVADVRRFPSSKKNPQYGRDALSVTLRDARIQYLWMGEQLGGFRTGGYEAFMGTELFIQGMTRLEASAREATTAVMCAEKPHTSCHRRFISDALVQRGWHVIHIVELDQTYEHTLQQYLF